MVSIVDSCLHLALILYEYFITLGAEVELFWREKISRTSTLFFLNRYLVLAYQLFQIRGQWTFSDLSLPLYFNTTRALIILCYVPWGVFSALRVLALTTGRRNKVLAVTVFLLSMGPVAVNFEGPTPLLILALANPLAVTIISRVSLIAADLIVIAVTWSPTYTAVRVGFGHRRITLPHLMFRDGLIYFIAMVTMNCLHLAFSITGSVSTVLIAADYVSEITEFTEPLTAILLWRFMLNLQEAGSNDGLRTESEFVNVQRGSEHLIFAF
ncbi:hypothetical protein LXA43DRAFT_905612 [Ganoderma leucocontextum]|nr:hypothetical protein LXA43DRAFT_905612 [Ganoderma leucocontextum]